MADHSLNDEQSQSMERIRQHLITNLSISREDGWSVANRVFEGTGEQNINTINKTISA